MQTFVAAPGARWAPAVLRRRGVAPAARSPARRACRPARASGDDKTTTGNAALDGALGVARGLVNAGADLVPDSVPRPVAKGGVALAGGLLAFWLLQKVVSTVLTLALLGGAAFLYFRSSSSSSGGGSSSSQDGGGARGTGDGGLDDPLADARRIMDKYK